MLLSLSPTGKIGVLVSSILNANQRFSLVMFKHVSSMQLYQFSILESLGLRHIDYIVFNKLRRFNLYLN